MKKKIEGTSCESVILHWKCDLKLQQHLTLLKTCRYLINGLNMFNTNPNYVQFHLDLNLNHWKTKNQLSWEPHLLNLKHWKAKDQLFATTVFLGVSSSKSELLNQNLNHLKTKNQLSWQQQLSCTPHLLQQNHWKTKDQLS